VNRIAPSYRSVLAVLFLALSSACAEPRSVDLQAVYDRTDRDFESAILFRPDDSAEGSPQWLLAPLLLVQNGEAGESPPVVYYEKTVQGWIYRWQGPDGSPAQGARVTLGEDGFPLAYEALRDSSGARLLFVDMSLEQRAAESHGAPLPGRRFSIERSRDSAPAVAVGGLFEPGPTPLGPFVYLWEESHDVNIVLCRCMPSRVNDIVESVAYELLPFDVNTVPFELPAPPPLADALRLPVE